ncbi:DUF5134 domain-containing protein [Mycobacterium gastri]|uniref:DUF5134 domain-containing protein n=1 Tax=Mycobacterium gastri TaxID=1777 RepID=A0A1X1VE73_MYCGS|nr:DUF5134 domain-containing protein [Mycobacterium gastri]ETW26456.1 hypothetical protein MGAST_20725 [Mycobacterium gastri 'Wayne']ORV67333.1 hypothetical protein AWC07_09170 [Mycobacterium gastri]
MIQHLMLRWVVTGLFALPAVDCGLAIIRKGRPWTSVVGHGLHFVMAVAMAVMAWPWSMQLPTTGPAVFFLLATAWFVTMAVVAAQTAVPRVWYGYHSLMMLATAWMYAIMNGYPLPIGWSTQHHPQPDTSVPGMDMAGMKMPATGSSPTWFSAVNWIGIVTFALAAAFFTGRHFIERKHQAPPSKSLGTLGQAMMAAGMAILFVATLFRI